MKNIIPENEITLSLQRPGSSPRFVYGVLMLPTVLKYYTDIDQRCQIHTTMTKATLFGCQLYQFKKSSTPVIIESSDTKSTVEGMLIFDLNEEQRNAIYELESGLMHLTSVQVKIRQKSKNQIHSVRMVEAGTFTWSSGLSGLIPLRNPLWRVDGFLKCPLYQHILDSQHRTTVGGSVWTNDQKDPGILNERQQRSWSWSGRNWEPLDSLEEELPGMW
ncbi:hypothetical protein N7478_013091 [Penicillium angulare]|uniref:uncharacterized protein n=1 Tax=Penicillium angulare TaxID=116970 RepID=UPI002541C280|nr:uncharacterized protein N7478_013091 [Penicillium angulare]KAJ5256987.1 hypothetical protein N7478_013091 [Penicillium angulare]